jgi:hypothetical protein
MSVGTDARGRAITKAASRSSYHSDRFLFADENRPLFDVGFNKCHHLFWIQMPNPPPEGVRLSA